MSCAEVFLNAIKTTRCVLKTLKEFMLEFQGSLESISKMRTALYILSCAQKYNRIFYRETLIR